jgi:hypothetical protein
MLNITFKPDSTPIDDAELQSVISEIGRLMLSEIAAEKQLALLLSKMVLRISIETAKNRSSNLTSDTSAPSGLNRLGVRDGEIIAHVARCAMQMKQDREEFSSMILAQMLRDELPMIAGRVSNDSFAVLMGVCGALLSDGAQSTLADLIAHSAVTKAQGKGRG